MAANDIGLMASHELSISNPAIPQRMAWTGYENSQSDSEDSMSPSSKMTAKFCALQLRLKAVGSCHSPRQVISPQRSPSPRKRIRLDENDENWNSVMFENRQPPRTDSEPSAADGPETSTCRLHVDTNSENNAIMSEAAPDSGCSDGFLNETGDKSKPSPVPQTPSKQKRRKSPPPPSPSKTAKLPADHDPFTWHESEITGHMVTSPDDDGYGINGIGFKPAPAIAYARARKRRQQIEAWRTREAREARQRRIAKRQCAFAANAPFEKLSSTESGDEWKFQAQKRVVRFV